MGGLCEIAAKSCFGQRARVRPRAGDLIGRGGGHPASAHHRTVAFAACSKFDNSLTGSTFPNAEVEPQAAVHGSTAIAMWHQDRRSNGGARGIGVGYSTDGGASWTETTIALDACSADTQQALSNMFRASDPWVSIGPDGIAYASALSFNITAPNNANAVVAASSADGGATWNHIQPVPGAFFQTADNSTDKNSTTADPTKNKTAYTVWDTLTLPTDNPDDNPHTQAYTGPAYFSKTTDGGKTTTEAVLDVPGGAHGGSARGAPAVAYVVTPCARLRDRHKTVRRYLEAAERSGLERSGGEQQLTDELLGASAEESRVGRHGGRGLAGSSCTRTRLVGGRLGQELQLTKIHSLLVRQGVSVPYQTLHRFFVQELGFGRQLRTVRVVDGEPGSELQVDFCRMGRSSTWVASAGSSVRAHLYRLLQPLHVLLAQLRADARGSDRGFRTGLGLPQRRLPGRHPGWHKSDRDRVRPGRAALQCRLSGVRPGARFHAGPGPGAAAGRQATASPQ